MFFAKLFCATLLFALCACSSVADRPNYLTEEEFAKARLIRSQAVNGTIFNPPHYDKKQHLVRINENQLFLLIHKYVCIHTVAYQ